MSLFSLVNRSRLPLGLSVAFLVPAAPVFTSEGPQNSFIVVGARVADGTGAPLRSVAVRVADGKIAAVGELKPAPDERVIEARGLVLAPGFIDVHNHSTSGVEREPLATSQVSQGLTTILVGQDGSSPLPVGPYLAKRNSSPAALNVATCVGHASVRRQVMGEDYKRAATAAEVLRMEALVAEAFEQGALCLSSGLEYEVGGYATTAEVIALSRIAAKYRGFYISHIRDEADRALESMAEIVEIGAKSGVAVQNTHVKLGTRAVWNKAREALAIFEAARAKGIDVTLDCYPWGAWSSTILVMIPSKKYEDPEAVARGLDDVGGAENVLVTSYEKDRSYEFRTLAEIARGKGSTPVSTFIEIVRGGGASVVVKSMVDADIRAFFAWPWTMVSSDGGIAYRHPRGAGSFPRVLGRFVRERGWLTLEEAVRKMTSLPAARLGLKDRGRIAPGFVADLTLFDPATVIDRATFTDPFQVSAGIEKVWVAGELVWSEGKSTGALPGRALLRPR